MNWSSLVLRQAVMCRRAAAQGDESPSLLLLVYSNILLYQCIAMVFALTQAFTHKLAKLQVQKPRTVCTVCTHRLSQRIEMKEGRVYWSRLSPRR